jgi:glycosyltransferase involved in cell wall biosynthesis
MPDVSVIVPARDASATIGRTLAGLGRQRRERSFEVIVVDDRSRDSTAAIARDAAVVARLVEGPGSGPADARNLGAAVARGSHLAFLDADCEPTPEWLARGVRALEHFDLVQGGVRPFPDKPIGAFDRTLWVNEAHGLFESANLFVRRELFERLGGFESWLRPRRGIELGEDVLLGWRARRGGARTGFCPEALVYHEVFARGPAAYVAERQRLRFFPAMACRIPELRAEFFYRRYFLSRRSALFDLALAGAVAAALSRKPLLASAAIPYLRELATHTRRANRQRAVVALVDLAADAAGAQALIAGSIANRTPVL